MMSLRRSSWGEGIGEDFPNLSRFGFVSSCF
mgnify:CR=1